MKSLEKSRVLVVEVTNPNTIEKSPTEITTDKMQQKLFAQNGIVLYQDDPKVSEIFNQLLELNNLVPYHRDILINLAIIEAEKTNLQAAREYLQEVEYSDPNNDTFK